jgi:hypothetical protein
MFLVQSQGYVYRSCSLLLAKAAGLPVLHGVDTPFLDCVFCCGCGACWLPVTFSSASTVVLSFGLLSVPADRFPSSLFAVFAPRDLVDCNGFHSSSYHSSILRP